MLTKIITEVFRKTEVHYKCVSIHSYASIKAKVNKKRFQQSFEMVDTIVVVLGTGTCTCCYVNILCVILKYCTIIVILVLV